MKRFYLTGQRTFANRGCEAIVRSTVSLLRDQAGDVEVLVPSNDVEADLAHWPDAESCGVRFVPDFFPAYTRFWAHLQRLPLTAVKQAGWPFRLPAWLRESIAGVDAVISIGGDNYSLDYRLPSLLMGVDGYAISIGKPVFLWGASVGPFDAEPDFVPVIARHLSRLSAVGVRETASEHYLKTSLGLRNVFRMSDPAFSLTPEHVDISQFWPEEGKGGVIGINVSPLVERYRNGGNSLRREVVDFIRRAVERYDLSVLLVPHVIPHDKSVGNNDYHYMSALLPFIHDLQARVRIMPDNLNAAQSKYVISRCRFFMGARTHATIAALSSGVPTVSIAYSIKAKGINRDLFGGLDAVLNVSDVTVDSMEGRLRWLFERETDIRETLVARLGDVRDLARRATERVVQALT